MEEFKLPKINNEIKISQEEWNKFQKDLRIARFQLQEINDNLSGRIDSKNLLGEGVKGFNVKDGTITADKILFAETNGLGSLALEDSIAYGDITGEKPPVDADVTLSAIQGGLSLSGGGLVLTSGGASLRGGQTAYETGTGFWLGDVGGVSKFSIGSPTHYLKWTGSVLDIRGMLTVGGSGTEDEIYFKDSTVWMYDLVEGTRKRIGWRYGDMNYAFLSYDNVTGHVWLHFNMSDGAYLWYTLQPDMGALKTSRNELWIGAGDAGKGAASWMRIYKTGQFALEGQESAPATNNFFGELAFRAGQTTTALKVYTNAWRQLTAQGSW